MWSAQGNADDVDAAARAAGEGRRRNPSYAVGSSDPSANDLDEQADVIEVPFGGYKQSGYGRKKDEEHRTLRPRKGALY